MTYIDFKYAIKLSFIKNTINHRPFEKCHPGCRENGIYSVRGQKYKNRYLACIIINDNGNSMTMMIITRKGGVCYCVCPFFSFFFFNISSPFFSLLSSKRVRQKQLLDESAIFHVHILNVSPPGRGEFNFCETFSQRVFHVFHK